MRQAEDTHDDTASNGTKHRTSASLWRHMRSMLPPQGPNRTQRDQPTLFLVNAPATPRPLDRDSNLDVVLSLGLHRCADRTLCLPQALPCTCTGDYYCVTGGEETAEIPQGYQRQLRGKAEVKVRFRWDLLIGDRVAKVHDEEGFRDYWSVTTLPQTRLQKRFAPAKTLATE